MRAGFGGRGTIFLFLKKIVLQHHVFCCRRLSLLTPDSLPPRAFLRRHGLRGEGSQTAGAGHPAKVLSAFPVSKPRASAQLLQLQKDQQGVCVVRVRRTKNTPREKNTSQWRMGIICLSCGTAPILVRPWRMIRGCRRRGRTWEKNGDGARTIALSAFGDACFFFFLRVEIVSCSLFTSPRFLAGTLTAVPACSLGTWSSLLPSPNLISGSTLTRGCLEAEHKALVFPPAPRAAKGEKYRERERETDPPWVSVYCFLFFKTEQTHQTFKRRKKRMVHGVVEHPLNYAHTHMRWYVCM